MASLSKNIAANYIGRTWTALLGIVLIPVYIRFLGMEAYGLVGFYATLTSVIGILDLGIGSTMNRELARRAVNSAIVGSQKDLVRTLEIVYWGIAIIAGSIIIISGSFIAHKWINAQEINPDSIVKAIQLMGISIAFQFPMSLYQGGLMGMQKQVLVNSILIFTGTLRGGGAILVLWLVSPTIQAFFAWQVVISFIGSLIFFIAIWSSLPKISQNARFKVGILSEIWKYAAAISSNAIIGIVLSQLDKIILSRMLPLKTFGYYSLATTAASAIWMILIPYNNAIFPRLVQLYEKKQNLELKKVFHQYSQLLSFLLLPAGAILILFSKELLSLWIKDPIIVQNSYLLMSLICLGTLLNGIASIPGNCANAFGWPMLVTYTNIIQAIVIIPLIIGLVYLFKAEGAAIAWIVMNSTYIIFMIPLFFRRFLNEEKNKWYFNDTLIPISSTFIICILSRILAPSLNTSFSVLLWLFSTGMIALITTGLTLSHIRAFSLYYIKIIFKSR
jgi:O-antigen/teichoic acid export membrane protein